MTTERPAPAAECRRRPSIGPRQHEREALCVNAHPRHAEYDSARHHPFRSAMRISERVGTGWEAGRLSAPASMSDEVLATAARSGRAFISARRSARRPHIPRGSSASFNRCNSSSASGAFPRPTIAPLFCLRRQRRSLRLWTRSAYRLSAARAGPACSAILPARVSTEPRFGSATTSAFAIRSSVERRVRRAPASILSIVARWSWAAVGELPLRHSGALP